MDILPSFLLRQGERTHRGGTILTAAMDLVSGLTFRPGEVSADLHCDGEPEQFEQLTAALNVPLAHP